MGTEWLVTICRWRIYVFSNWRLLAMATDTRGLLVTTGDIWWWHVGGHWGPRGNYLSPLYCQIIDSVRKIGATAATWNDKARVKCDIFERENDSHHLKCASRAGAMCSVCPENHCVTWVTWGHLADKNSKWRASRCRVTEGRLSNEQHWEGVHCPQSKLELGHEKFKMDPCNF